MYYVSGKRGKYVAVTESLNGSKTIYTVRQLNKYIKRGVEIKGVFKVGNKTVIIPLNKTSLTLLTLGEKDPVRVKLSKGLDYRQSIFVGYDLDTKNANIIFSFFDDSGLDGCFGVTSKEVISNKDIKFDYKNIDISRAEYLVKRWTY